MAAVSPEPLFLFGTLRHRPLLEAIVGTEGYRLVTGTLKDHEIRRVADHAHPVLMHKDGANASGLVCMDLSVAQLEALDFYEDLFEYTCDTVEIETDRELIKAQVYRPNGSSTAAADPWSLGAWAEKWAAMTVHAAKEVMSLRSKIPDEELRQRFPTIRARAWSSCLGQRHPVRSDRRLDLTTPTNRHLGSYRLDEHRFRHETFNGALSEEKTREVFVGFDAALVLPYDPESDRLVLIEQMRIGPVARSDPDPWLLEPIAGLVDPGEDPAETARREAQEEAGLALTDLEPIANVYPSPGGSSDYFHCFLGRCTLESKGSWIGGLVEEGEDIRVHVLSTDDALAKLDHGDIRVAPLAMMLLWLARHRSRLQASA